MKKSNVMRTALLVLGSLFFLGPMSPPIAAQDVLRAGAEAGVAAPAWVRRMLRDDPDAFEFSRVWKRRVEAVRAARDAIEAGGPAGVQSATGLAAGGAAITGSLQVPVVAARYYDLGAPFSEAALAERLFGGGSGAVSVRDFYLENSGGLFTFGGQVTPWVAMPQATAYYEPPAGDEKFGRVGDFLIDALTGADGAIDFSQFDNDGPDGIPNSGDDDGYVDVVAFVYPTVAATCGGDATGIWPHRWTVSSARFFNGDGVASSFVTDDPSALGGTVWISDYIIQSAFQCNGSMMGTGTISHELGHALDLPDLYDTDEDDGTDSQGIGYWGLMGSGNWNTQMSPAHLSAWSKDLLGWVDVTTVAATTDFALGPVETGGAVLRVPLPESGEYLLLSNRQPIGSDQNLRGSGLLIWHIDPSRAGTISARGNRQNVNPARKAVDLEAADGLEDLDFSNNRGDAGDPFPGSTGNTEFADFTNPHSRPSSTLPVCTAAVRLIAGGGGSVSGRAVPSERWVVWGDADGTRVLARADASEAFWYGFGYRDAPDQRFIDQADVDGDGDIDARDGFLIFSFVEGRSVPGGRLGNTEVRACGPVTAPGLVAPFRGEVLERGSSGGRGGVVRR